MGRGGTMLWTVRLCLLLAASSSGVPLDRYSTKGQHKVLLVSFDGFRWDYDRDVDTPNLDTMAKDGVKARYVTPPYHHQSHTFHPPNRYLLWIDTQAQPFLQAPREQ
uniref:Ectonucleotide pyrophosphatase/phosphodiesterase family member 6 n=1 Tax=Oncorhynchus kisutch TaxID=8019 RepID=A0A8C7CIK9_ONCKI